MSLRKRIGEAFGVQSGLEGDKPSPPPAVEDKPAGLVCRTCGCRHFYPVGTRPALGGGGRIMRRRECRHCGRKVTTYETPVEAPPDDPNLPWWKQRRGTRAHE